MKWSIVVGVVMLYMVIVGLELMATSGGGGISANTTSGAFANLATENSSVVIDPTYKSQSVDFTASAYTILTDIGANLNFWTKIFTLRSPTLFNGIVMEMTWWYFCFPIDCGMAFAIMTIIRGVRSS